MEEKCQSSNVLIINSLAYINEDQIRLIIDWFASGKEPGMIAIGFVYSYMGPELISRYKFHLLKKLKFFASVPMMNRYLQEAERMKFGHEFGTYSRAYYEVWYLTREK